MARYGTPGTPELAAAMEPLVQGHDAILMANHGVVTCGPDLLTAYLRMETTEHFARVALVTQLLGKQEVLSNDDVQKLHVARVRYGAGAEPANGSGGAAGSDRSDAERVTLTRRELDSLVDEAVRRDRARR